MRTVRLRAHYYQQFDADHGRDVPAETYGGWKAADLDVSLDHTALAVMHAGDTGTPERYPGWWRAVEYMARGQAICREVFPPLLAAVRGSGLTLFHVAGGGRYHERYPGYRRTVELAGPEPPPLPAAVADPVLEELRRFRRRNVFVGEHNEADVRRGFEDADFPAEGRPLGDEPVACTAHQLAALANRAGVNHLVYAGFAINWCLLMSSGGMLDMSRRGFMCSAIRQAVTAVENRETARSETCKELALWRVALAFGFVFDAPDFIQALRGASPPAGGDR